MTFSVVVSCYKPHLQKLLRLLDSIEAQTVRPQEVLVSTSSTHESDLPTFPNYSFELKVVHFEERRNAAENRNTAAGLASGNYLTFIDADDIMHPQRLEALAVAIKQGAEFIMHNYFPKHELQADFPSYSDFAIEHGCLRPAPSGCVVHIANRPIHHSLSTVKRLHFEKVRFQTGKDYERREDAVFCNGIVRLGVPTAVIHNKLAKYDEAGSWEHI